jgi:hypothetical protein
MASSAPDSSEAGFKDRFFDYFKQEAAGEPFTIFNRLIRANCLKLYRNKSIVSQNYQQQEANASML